MANHPRLALRRPTMSAEPDISNAYKAVVESALRWAWAQVCSRWPDVIADGREEEITERMQSVLNEHGADDRRLAPGLNSFETVIRGAKVVAADGRIEKAPDLVLRPPPSPGVRNRNDWGAFVECKIIAPPNHHSAEAYCITGVARFVCGEYAARMPSAVMLAYVRDGRRPHETLDPLLAAAAYKTKSHDPLAADTTRSHHTRRALSQPCIDIRLTHLWLDQPKGVRPRKRAVAR